MEMNPNRAYPVERYRAAERQGGLCWICRVVMVDRRVCSRMYEYPCGPRQHIHVKKKMPRFNLVMHTSRGTYGTTLNCDRRHFGDPHAATFIGADDVIRAAHLSCVISVRSRTRAHNASEESAIQELRGRAGQRATCWLHDNPVDNPGTRNQNAQPQPLEERNQGVTPHLETHSVDTQYLGTQVTAQLAREAEHQPRCPRCHAPAPATLHHPYDMPCCGLELTLIQAMRVYS